MANDLIFWGGVDVKVPGKNPDGTYKKPTDVAGWAEKMNFYVTNTGHMVAKSGIIGGWSFDSRYFQKTVSTGLPGEYRRCRFDMGALDISEKDTTFLAI